MKVLIDTSVVIAAIVQSHPHHRIARPWLDRAMQGVFEFVVSGHSLAECYSTMTRLPLAPPITPQEAWALIGDNVLGCAKVIVLAPGHYSDVVEAMSVAGLSGGIIYDAIIAKAGEIAGVERVLTLNVSHFQRVWRGDPDQVISPEVVSPP